MCVYILNSYAYKMCVWAMLFLTGICVYLCTVIPQIHVEEREIIS